jgi:hypothetical protein
MPGAPWSWVTPQTVPGSELQLELLVHLVAVHPPLVWHTEQGRLQVPAVAALHRNPCGQLPCPVPPVHPSAQVPPLALLHKYPAGQLPGPGPPVQLVTTHWRLVQV